jgi:hypothetical protein
MEDDFTRETQPDGSLVEPPRKPPTAVALATAPVPERNRPAITPRASGGSWLGSFISRTLDVVDVLGDAVAEALQLRPSGR